VADVDGVVTGIEAEVGQVVAAGTPVLRIAQDGARDVVFAVPEDKVVHLKVGQAVRCAPGPGGETLPGQVREVAASADPVTRTFAVKAGIDSAGLQAPPLGATVHVVPRRSGSGGLAGHQAADHGAAPGRGRSTAVWVYEADSGTVRSQPVQVATADGNDGRDRGLGLAPGMQVVSTGVHVLTPGQKVTVFSPKNRLQGSPVKRKHATKTVAQ
jgi:multidrug efflux system membrane fusion protein